MKVDISLGNSGASNCWTRQMKDAFGDLQNGTVYNSDLLQCRKLNISNLRIDLSFRHQAVWREAQGGQDPCSCLKSLWLITTGLLCLDFSSVFIWFDYRLFSKLPLKCPPEAYSDVTLPYLCLRDRFLMHVHHLSCRSI